MFSRILQYRDVEFSLAFTGVPDTGDIVRNARKGQSLDIYVTVLVVRKGGFVGQRGGLFREALRLAVS